ncbi:MAG TPA: SUMF1/EgtB/PvdO family nonheme iron enzyme, partial [Vicinamibacterales bacterium]|nr:SUMF1/EgtB/PvdO family nonheme iron enzyme [Vicinamibacterales bacterium]
MSVRAASPVWVALVALLAACSAPSRDQSQHDRAAGAPDSAPGAVARISTAPPPGTAPDGMVWIPGGTFWMGCEGCGMPDALPSHLVEVDGFWMDRAPVTNTEFARFVNQTGYVTVAERPLDPAQYPGVPRDKLVSGSAV